MLRPFGFPTDQPRDMNDHCRCRHPVEKHRIWQRIGERRSVGECLECDCQGFKPPSRVERFLERVGYGDEALREEFRRKT